MKNFILNAFLLTSTLSFAQPAIDWEQSLGGSEFESAAVIHPTSDGGFISIGQTMSIGGDVTGFQGGIDYWVVKTDNLGTLVWQKTYGGSSDDIGTAIQETTGGGFIMIGYSTSADGDISNPKGSFDAWVVRTDNAGTIIWEVSLGGSGLEYGSDIRETSDGGFIIGARSNSLDGDVTGGQGDFDTWIVKLTSAGTISWQKTYGGSGADGATAIKQTADGGYFFSGFTTSNDGDVSTNNGNYDYWCGKIDGVGNLAWEKSLGGSGEDIAYAMDVTASGTYLITGSSKSIDGDVTNNHGYYDFWTVEVASNGSLLNQLSLGGDSDDDARSIVSTSNGSFFIAGRTSSSSVGGDVVGNHGAQDFWVVKVDSAFVLQWQLCLGGTGNDFANGMDILNDGAELIIAGHASSANGDVTTSLGGGDFWVVKLAEPDAGINGLDLNVEIYPNPTKNYLHVVTQGQIDEILIVDSFGSLVRQETTAFFDVQNLANGVYLLYIKTNGAVVRSRFVKE